VPNFHASALARSASLPAGDLPGNAEACGALEQLRTPAQLRALARCLAAWGMAASVAGAQFACIAKFLGEHDEENVSSDEDLDVVLPLQLLSLALADETLRDATLEHERGAQLLFTLLRRMWRTNSAEPDLLALASAVCARHALHADVSRASTQRRRCAAPRRGAAVVRAACAATRRLDAAERGAGARHHAAHVRRE
jgi:hypothetical protein